MTLAFAHDVRGRLYVVSLHDLFSVGRCGVIGTTAATSGASALAPDQVALGRKLVEDGKPVREVARLLKVHRATLYHELARAAASPA